MDVRELAFESESFDVAIDKGTMDAMMTAKADVWVDTSKLIYADCIVRSHANFPQDPPEDVIENCTREVNEVLR